MYDNEFETKENNIRINENIEYTHTLNAHFSLTIYYFSEKYFAGIVTWSLNSVSYDERLINRTFKNKRNRVRNLRKLRILRKRTLFHSKWKTVR